MKKWKTLNSLNFRQNIATTLPKIAESPRLPRYLTTVRDKG